MGLTLTFGRVNEIGPSDCLFHWEIWQQREKFDIGNIIDTLKTIMMLWEVHRGDNGSVTSSKWVKSTVDVDCWNYDSSIVLLVSSLIVTLTLYRSDGNCTTNTAIAQLIHIIPFSPGPLRISTVVIGNLWCSTGQPTATLNLMMICLTLLNWWTQDTGLGNIPVSRDIKVSDVQNS